MYIVLIPCIIFIIHIFLCMCQHNTCMIISKVNFTVSSAIAEKPIYFSFIEWLPYFLFAIYPYLWHISIYEETHIWLEYWKNWKIIKRVLYFSYFSLELYSCLVTRVIRKYFLAIRVYENVLFFMPIYHCCQISNGNNLDLMLWSPCHCQHTIFAHFLMMHARGDPV